MSTFTKVFCALVVLWIIATFSVFVYPYSFELAGRWGFFDVVFSFSLLVAFIVYSFFPLERKYKKQALVTMFLATLVIWLLWNYQLQYGSKLHLYFYRNEYEEVTKKLLATNIENERKTICAGKCLILNNEPLRVSFPYARGFVTLKDIVYDPSERIVNDINETELAKRSQIDVRFAGADHLRNEWYLVHLEYIIK